MVANMHIGFSIFISTTILPPIIVSIRARSAVQYG